MGIFGKKLQNCKGFTIIELIVVITVIGILAAIVLVAYPNYQRQTRNNERKNDLTQLATALNTYAIQKNNYMGQNSGCGYLNGGNGWATFTNPGWYDKSVTKCLGDAGVLKLPDDILDPSGCRSDSGGICGGFGNPTTTPTTAYMKATCEKNGKPAIYVMAYLEGEPRKDAEVDVLCDVGSMEFFSPASQKWGTSYGMNYYVKVL